MKIKKKFNAISETKNKRIEMILKLFTRLYLFNKKRGIMEE